jgi:putative chitinase
MSFLAAEFVAITNMLTIDSSTFMKLYQQGSATLQPAAASGLVDLEAFLAEDPDIEDLRWAAYMLATVKHECAD